MNQPRAAAVAILFIWCSALLLARVVRTGMLTYTFLGWNLMLALVPLIASTMLARVRKAPAKIAWSVLWLAFLPNAPYIATDLIHLRARSAVPLWYDAALLFSCAATGTLLGYISLADVQRLIAKRFGAAVSWMCAAFALLLCGFGIYLGRFLRWNSWAIAADPGGLFADVFARLASPMSHPRTFGVTIVYGCGLVMGYLAFAEILLPGKGEGSRSAT